MPMAPAMTLNRMYHWVPSSMSTIGATPSPPPLPIRNSSTTGNRAVAGTERWRLLILPGIFPFLITGMVTAAGGAWNASIVAEYFHFKGRTLQTTGLGSLISAAADSGNFDQLLSATVVLAAIVVVTNRLVWRPLYRLAETRYRLET